MDNWNQDWPRSVKADGDSEMQPGSRRRRAFVVTLLFASAGSSASATAALPSENSGGYRFFLDGAQVFPEIVSVMGQAGKPAPGDLIDVGGFTLTLGDEQEYHFQSAQEGLRLETPDGRRRWVAVRVETDYHGERGFVDGMASLTPDEVRGLWSLRAETWTPSCASRAGFLDVSRLFLTLGQSSSEGQDDLPELPSGLRYLEAMRFVGWQQLEGLTDLVYLDLLPEKEFDLRTLARLQRLKVLSLFSGRLMHENALAHVRALE